MSAPCKYSKAKMSSAAYKRTSSSLKLIYSNKCWLKSFPEQYYNPKYIKFGVWKVKCKVIKKGWSNCFKIFI